MQALSHRGAAALTSTATTAWLHRNRRRRTGKIRAASGSKGFIRNDIHLLVIPLPNSEFGEFLNFSMTTFFYPLNRKGIFYYFFSSFSLSNGAILYVFSERRRNCTVPSLHFQSLYCHILVNQLSLLCCAEITFLYLQCRSAHLFSQMHGNIFISITEATLLVSCCTPSARWKIPHHLP